MCHGVRGVNILLKFCWKYSNRKTIKFCSATNIYQQQDGVTIKLSKCNQTRKYCNNDRATTSITKIKDAKIQRRVVEFEMMVLNNNAGASTIFYLCATSMTVALLICLGTIEIVDAAANGTLQNLQQQQQQLHRFPLNASPTMHDSTEMFNKNNSNSNEESNHLNHFEKNNRNDGIIALSLLPLSSPASSSSSTLRDWHNSTHLNNVHHSDQHTFEMENSRKYLHLDEHNFVATTPKILTTKLPSRYVLHS